MSTLLERLRTLLILGRVSNLPTVWSNLIVGWMMADGPRTGLARIDYHGPNETALMTLLLGGSLLYVGGMYLNDYCDAVFDARYCTQRPIPSEKISRRIVGLVAALLFTAGLACFTSFGPVTIAFALILISAIILYDFHHKNVAWAPILMGVCRCLLYLLAFSAFNESYYFNLIYGDWWSDIQDYLRGDFWSMALEVIWFLLPALPLGLYVVGLTYLARGESRPGHVTRWPILLLLGAVVLMVVLHGYVLYSLRYLLVQNPQEFFLYCLRTLGFCLLLPAWIAWLLVPFWRRTKPSVGRVISGLLAGIVLLDMIVVSVQIGPAAVELLPLFLLALLLQRIIPAT